MSGQSGRLSKEFSTPALSSTARTGRAPDVLKDSQRHFPKSIIRVGSRTHTVLQSVTIGLLLLVLYLLLPHKAHGQSVPGSATVGIGTSSPLTQKGDLYGFSTTDARIPIGADTTCLIADSTQPLGLKWAGCGAGGSSTTGTGWWHNTAGSLDAASRAVDVSSADITGTLAAARFGALTGDTTSAGGTYATTLKNTGTAGTYQQVTTDAQGRVTTGVTRTINTSSPLGGGGALSSDLTLTCAGCLTSVTAHNLLSGTHGDTVAASPVRGDMIIANSTPAWTKLALGVATAGKYAKSNGTDVVISTGSASGTGACSASQWASTLNADAAPTCTQPAYSDLSGNLFNGGITLPNVKFVNAQLGNLASGDTDVYTVPVSKKAVVVGLTIFNNNVATDTFFPEWKISGTYYRISASSTANTVSAATQVGTFQMFPVMAAGEIFAINNSVATTNIWLQVIEFDATSPLATAKLTSLAAGDNTVYTVTAAKTSILLPGGGPMVAESTSTSPNTLAYVNVSGGNRTIKWFVVASGGTTATTNQISASTVVATAAMSRIPAQVSLSAGDFIVINTDANTATQMAWVTYIELP